MQERSNMKVAGGLQEDGIVIGNTYDKYGSRNPVVRYLMKGYEESLNEMVDFVKPESIHEVGCGEGYWSLKWLEKGIATRGSDFSKIVIDMARSNARERGLPDENFVAKDIYDLDPGDDKANLVVCCQVLEHLERPDEALKVLQRIASPYLIICVPCEPKWSFLNMARGKYWADMGNTPGHIQRWSKKEFVKLAARYFDVVKVNSPLPWTMLLCKTRQ